MIELFTALVMLVVVAGAVVAVGVGNVLHAIFGLAVSLLGIAGVFLLLHSPFVAVMQVIIYVGGISVAMIFAVMLSTVVSRRRRASHRRRLLAALAALLVFASLAGVVTSVPTLTAEAAHTEAWSVATIGVDLLNRFNVVFEALSLVLLVAIIGAIAISRREPARAEGSEGTPS